MTHLDRVKVWGKQFKVAPSKHSIVQMPKEGQPVSHHCLIYIYAIQVTIRFLIIRNITI